MGKVLRLAPPSRLVSLETLDVEMKKHGIPHDARARAIEIARVFDREFKVPRAEFCFPLPDGLTDEQAAAIEAQLQDAVTRYHEAWRLALLDFSGSLQSQTVLAAMGIQPRQSG